VLGGVDLDVVLSLRTVIYSDHGLMQNDDGMQDSVRGRDRCGFIDFH